MLATSGGYLTVTFNVNNSVNQCALSCLQNVQKEKRVTPALKTLKGTNGTKAPAPFRKKGDVGGGGMTDLTKKIRVELFASDENKRIMNLPYLNMLW